MRLELEVVTKGDPEAREDRRSLGHTRVHTPYMRIGRTVAKMKREET